MNIGKPAELKPLSFYEPLCKLVTMTAKSIATWTWEYAIPTSVEWHEFFPLL